MPEAPIIRVQHQHGHVLVTVAGEIDIGTSGQLRGELAALAAGGRPLIVELDQVRFIDASGLGAIAGAAKRAAAHGTSLHVVAAQPGIRQLFAVTGLDRHIPLTRTFAEAVAALPSGSGPGVPATGSQAGAGTPGHRTRGMPIRFIPPAKHPSGPPASQRRNAHNRLESNGDQ